MRRSRDPTRSGGRDGLGRLPDDDPDLVARLTHPDYDGVVERAVIVTVDAYDWNCRQHITPRYTTAELEPLLAGVRQRLESAEAEVAELSRELAAVQ